MKKGLLIPLFVLAVILGFCVRNSAVMAERSARWGEQIELAEQYAASGNWEGAARAVEDGYADWSSCQTWLHCVTGHDAVDDAEAMYHRALAFAKSEEDSEFRAETADLRAQLRLLAEMEEFSLRNIL